MRRTNIRKRKKFNMIEINNKYLKTIITLCVILALCSILYIFYLKNILIKKNFEDNNIYLASLNENVPFSVNKIVLFSSATANDSTISDNGLDISQYCDIAIYLNDSNGENTSIKELYLDDFKATPTEMGNVCFYSKQFKDLGKSTFDNSLVINDTLNFNIINSIDDENSSSNALLSDLSSPLCIGFYNKNITENFMPSSDTEMQYNGTILKTALIPLSSLKCNISFCINILTENDEHYIYTINLDIPFENNTENLYTSGYIVKEISGNQVGKFLRIQ